MKKTRKNTLGFKILAASMNIHCGKILEIVPEQQLLNYQIKIKVYFLTTVPVLPMKKQTISTLAAPLTLPKIRM
ncbi:hypothetical protein [Flavobacterium sp. UGB4466]|uniref:hypothetical protein n=1 Tax=Flavobacterium sp. UGB4466 TaxID=2730889 RepID=UPI00192B7FA2|nr:hypothetical protein [Flavobacterium sp. UGB4466]